MRPSQAISFRASDADVAQKALDRLTARYGQCAPEKADVIVGGLGILLSCLRYLGAHGPRMATIAEALEELLGEG